MYLKACRRCGAEKPLAEFYKHPQMADGRVNKCKGCARADVRRNREENIEHYREYDRARGCRPDRRAAVARYQTTDRGREAASRAKRAWSERNRDRRLAQIELGNAIRDGKVTPWPVCANPDCQEQDRIQGHHPNYDRPLSVVWLCSGCHSRLHREHREYQQLRSLQAHEETTNPD